MRSLTLDGVELTDDSDCYVIAEIGHNHQGDVEKCKELFRAAKECGADAVKLQKRDNRALFTRAMYDSRTTTRTASGRPTARTVRRSSSAATSTSSCSVRRELGITFFATAFDIPQRRLPGRARHAGVQDRLRRPQEHAAAAARGAVRQADDREHRRGHARGRAARLRHDHADQSQLCRPPVHRRVPAPPSTSSTWASSRPTGSGSRKRHRLSDHDNGIAMAVAAYVLGARVIEKHFTLNRAMKGTDHAFSLEPMGLRKLVRDLRRARGGARRRDQAHVPSEGAVDQDGRRSSWPRARCRRARAAPRTTWP